MKNRRSFLKNATSIALGTSLIACRKTGTESSNTTTYTPSERLLKFKKIAQQPVLNKALISSPIIIEAVELFKSGEHYFTKVTSKEGTYGISLNAKKYIQNIYPIIQHRIAPIVIGKDARDIEHLIEKDIYIRKLNYKWQGLAFWVGVAYIEIAILDLLGKISGKPIGALLGGRVREEVQIYYASSHRENSPEEEAEYLLSLTEKSGAKAVKYRLGARMKYTDFSTKRDKGLIPQVRKVLGDDATIYTDANGSYDVKLGIEIGKILQDYGTAFFEEPCPFDHYEETKAIAEALDIPIAGGEEEVSMRQFMWMMDHDVLSVVQPDLLFFGGLIRSRKIAKMAEAIGKQCTPHISGFGLGFLNMLHFISCVPNIGSFQEYKGDKDNYPVTSPDSELKPKDGKIQIPKGPGLGIEFDPRFLQKAKKINSIA